MRNRNLGIVACALSITLLAACSDSSTEQPVTEPAPSTGVSTVTAVTTTAAPVVTEAAPTPTVSSTSGPTTSAVAVAAAPVRVEVNLGATSDTAPAGWTVLLQIPYGDGPDNVGLDVGGDPGGAAYFGPDFGVRLPDGRFAVLNTSTQELKLFDDSGRFSEAVAYPSHGGLQIASGSDRYVTAMAAMDGVAVFDLETGTSRLLPNDGLTVWQGIDPETGLLLGGRADGVVGLDLQTGEVGPLTPPPPGAAVPTSFTATSVALQWNAGRSWAELVANTDLAGELLVGREAVVAADGDLVVLLYGSVQPADLEAMGTSVGRLVILDAAGTVTADLAIAEVFTDYDSGSPGHLTLDPVTGRPLLWRSTEQGLEILTTVW